MTYLTLWEMVIQVENKETTKYYWLKMERGFFKRHDITIIENYGGGYPDGQLMVNLYMRLLVESIDHNGNLRFSDEKPYNNMMLSAITGLDIKIVEKGMECFKEFDLIRVLSDGTIFMTKVEKMFGAGSSTERVKKWREKQKEQHDNNDDETSSNVTETVDKPTFNEVKPKKERAVFIKPTLDDVREYIRVSGKKVDPESFWNFYESKGWYVGKNKMVNWHSAVATFSRNNGGNNNGGGNATPQQKKDNRKNEIFERTLKKHENGNV